MSFGLLITAVLFLALREARGRGFRWLTVSLVFFLALGATSGRTLEGWMLLRQHTELSMDTASVVVDATVDGLEVAAWSSLGAFAVQRTRRG